MRRDFLKLLALAGLGLAVPASARELLADDKSAGDPPPDPTRKDEPYPGPYYAVFNASGGWDTTYLMDP